MTDHLDPRWEWLEVQTLSDPAPHYVKGRCRHIDVVPVESGGEVVAALCLTCETQLDTGWPTNPAATANHAYGCWHNTKGNQ